METHHTKIFLFVFALVLLISSASAQTFYNQSTGLTYGSANLETIIRSNFTTNSTPINIHAIYKDSLSQAQSFIIENSSGSAIVGGTFSGDRAESNDTTYTFLPNTEYHIRWICSPGCNFRYTNTATLPIERQFIYFQQSDGDPAGRYWNLDLIEITLASNVEVNLISPTNGYSTYNSTNLEFNFSLNSFESNLTNATLFIWNSTGDIYNQTTVDLTGTSNSSSLIVNISDYGTYQWNVIGTSTNGTYYFFGMTLSNYTFYYVPFAINNESYQASVYETSYQNFSLLFNTAEDVIAATNQLIYGEKSYLASSSCSGIQCQSNVSLDIPLINNSAASQNKSFYWNITVFFNSGNSLTFLTQDTANNQTINRIYLQECGGSFTIRTLNFTAWDEQNLTRIKPFSLESTFNYWLGTGSVFRNQSFDNSSINEIDLCISPPDRVFKVDSQIDYDSAIVNTSYNTRNYYFQNASINNDTQEIYLYLLNSSFSTSFIQKVITTSQIPVQGALIFTQRYYPENNSYQTVSITKTNADGKSVGFYQTEIPNYRHIISKNGEILETTPQTKIFPESVPYTLTFTIGESFDNPWEGFGNISGLFSNMYYNETTKIVSYEWIDITGTLSIANLTVEQQYLNQTNNIVCSTSSELQAGILTCNLSAYSGTLIAKGYIGRSPQVLDILITIVIDALKSALAQPFLFLWILFLIAGMAMTFFFPIAGIPLTIMFLIIGQLLGIVGIGWVFIWAIIGVGVWILIETSR